MKKRIILCALLIGLVLAACQTGPFAPESTPITIPTRLILPTSTVKPYALTQPTLDATSIQHSLATATPLPSSLPFTLGPSPAPTRVTRYSILARGIELDEDTGKVDPTRLKADFGIVYGGSGGENVSPNMGVNILALSQAHIPCLLLWDILIPQDADASNMDKSFPSENEEPNVVAISRAVKSGPVAGVIIRFLDKKTPDGKVFTQTWMANYINWMVKAVYHQSGRPLFVMTSQAFIDGFGHAPELNNAVSTIDGMCSWKAATPGQTPQPASWNDFPFPPDDYHPEYISNNSSLAFINYSRTSWKFDGIDAKSTPLWIYEGSADQLKKDLGYKENSTNFDPSVSG